MDASKPFALPSGLPGRLAGWWMARAHRPLAVWALEALQLQPGDRVLDAGCGPGTALELAARALRDGFAVGVDPSAPMCKQARRRNRAAIAAGRLAVVRAGAPQLPFREGCFDKALAINTIRAWPEPFAGVEALGRALRRGGRLVVVVQAHGDRAPSQVATHQERCVFGIEAAGFGVLEACVRRVHRTPALRIVAERARGPALSAGADRDSGGRPDPRRL